MPDNDYRSYNWDDLVNNILGLGEKINRGAVTGKPWIWLDSAVIVPVTKQTAKEPADAHGDKNTLVYYRPIIDKSKRHAVNAGDVFQWQVVRVKIDRDHLDTTFQAWWSGIQNAVAPIRDGRSHPNMSSLDFVNAAYAMYHVQQLAASTSVYLDRVVKGIDSEASGFSGSAAEVFSRQMENLAHDARDLFNDVGGWWKEMLETARAIDLFNGYALAMVNRAADRHNIVGDWYVNPYTIIVEIMNGIKASPDGQWTIETIVEKQRAHIWNFGVNLGAGAGGVYSLISPDQWAQLNQTAQKRWTDGVETQFDRMAQSLVPLLGNNLEKLYLSVSGDITAPTPQSAMPDPKDSDGDGIPDDIEKKGGGDNNGSLDLDDIFNKGKGGGDNNGSLDLDDILNNGKGGGNNNGSLDLDDLFNNGKGGGDNNGSLDLDDLFNNGKGAGDPSGGASDFDDFLDSLRGGNDGSGLPGGLPPFGPSGGGKDSDRDIRPPAAPAWVTSTTSWTISSATTRPMTSSPPGSTGTTCPPAAEAAGSATSMTCSAAARPAAAWRVETSSAARTRSSTPRPTTRFSTAPTPPKATAGSAV
ncbi:hypothetical protein Pflav_011030 [Phytohabitans flavus]|uniref:Uncharacterized protein n=1 Tax=Phytohabitans flavus TaxID=1076124 RepID=A0A6F8XLL0_9ACTN|nr:hypothetical protein [Phytohabitans flavus]BCB74693.1 hypothetical protein Pflav_011030 [Phytohabitans flavus]